MTKKQKSKSGFTIAALAVSGLGLIATGIIVLVRGMVGVGVYTPDPNNSTINFLFGGNNGIFASIGVIVLGIAAYFLLEPDKVRRFISGRQAKYGSNALIMSIAFVGILVVVNMLAYQNPKQLADATEDKSNTLAPETLQALATLPEKVTAVAFYTTNLSPDSATKLLSDFKANSKGKFDFSFVNPDTNPGTAHDAGITGDGKILLTMGGHKEIASSASETELTKALIRLINPTARAVYFLTGHGEPDTQAATDNGFSTASQTLKNKNYTINTLNLLTDNKIPSDALTIIIAGPQKPVSKEEVTLLKKHVDAGGSLVVMEDPTIMTSFGDSPDPLAEYLASDWGIVLDKDIIIDLQTQQGLNAVSAQYNPHPITQNLTNSFAVIMPNARSLTISTQPKDVTQTPLLYTSDKSWGEMNFTNAQGSQVQFDQGTDIPGPLTMAIAATNSSTKGRVVVFGNSIFAANKAFEAYGNGNIFVNSVDWAAEQENLINITPRTPITRTFTPPAQGWFVFILLGSVCLFPGLIVLMGASAWLSRRNKG